MSWDETQEITNGEDLIDSREIIARIAYLESMDCEADSPEARGEIGEGAACSDDCPSCSREAQDELKVLREVEDEARSVAGDWAYGETLIRDTYFEKFAQQFAEEIGAIPDDASWPVNNIDWEAAARELQMDYSSVDFAGVTYWVR